jgi:hypothetical protein
MSRYDTSLPEYRLTRVLVEWHDVMGSPFIANICRLDDPWNREFYEGLMINPNEGMFDSYDSEIFFYTHTQEEFDNLFKEDSGEEFRLIMDLSTEKD